MNKLLVTNYILLRLCEWFYQLNPEKKSNDLSILKSLKLIFILSTIRKDQLGLNLLDHGFTFNAMPYGPVEVDIYREYKNGNLNIISSEGVDFNALKEMSFGSELGEFKVIIDENLMLLQKENYYLISNSASYLVDLTHLFNSWKVNFKRAKVEGLYSITIPSDEIKEDKQYFSL